MLDGATVIASYSVAASGTIQLPFFTGGASSITLKFSKLVGSPCSFQVDNLYLYYVDVQSQIVCDNCTTTVSTVIDTVYYNDCSSSAGWYCYDVPPADFSTSGGKTRIDSHVNGIAQLDIPMQPSTTYTFSFDIDITGCGTTDVIIQDPSTNENQISVTSSGTYSIAMSTLTDLGPGKLLIYTTNCTYYIDNITLITSSQQTVTVCDPIAINDYRYGFNGKENDNEVKGNGNQQDYGMRIYDPRLGRFLSTDPLFKEYPGLTTYQFASNSPIWMIDVDGLEGNPYNGEIPELPADGGRYGKRGIDWDAVANPAGEVPIAVKNAGIGPEGKYYWSPTTDVTGRLIWQKPVKVTTCETVEYKVTKTVTEIIPATPPGKGFKNGTTPILPYFRNGWAKTDMNNVNLAVGLAGVRVNSAKKSGIPTSIDFTAQEDNSVTQGILNGLKTTYGLPVNLKIDNTITSDYNFKVNYKVPTVTPGTPEQVITKEVTETKTKLECETECKQ